jgi:hypothetical protein
MVEEQSAQRSTRDELLHQIRKLRWIGMESDAEALERVIREVRPMTACCPNRQTPISAVNKFLFGTTQARRSWPASSKHNF